ncbi:hypothetical protein, partial [Planktothrix sp.]|uniref:hypothetical protein n=1 Tax=Planktothrix sp. TaxID=3088171 RepID=UPI0038D3D45D
MSGTRKSTFTNIRTKKNGNTGGERTGKNTDEQIHTSQKINDSSNSFSYPNSTPEPELNDEQTETPQEKLTNRLSKYNELLPTGTNTNTDKELTELMLKIPREKRNIRLDLYCIVYFFDRLVSENKEPIDQKQYLSAISLAEKSVQSITNLVKNKPVIFDQDVFLKQGLNINGWYQEIPEKIKDITTAIQSSEDRDLHDDMIKKFKKRHDIQNY